MSDTRESVSAKERRVQRKLDHQCLWCGEDAAPDSDHCQRHTEHRRALDRVGKARRRAKLRKRGRCVDCKRKSKAYRCDACLAKSVRQAPVSVGEREEIWRVDPGTTWNRFRGKGRRGRLTREQQREEDKRDARWAIRELEKFIANVDELEAADELPPIQRKEARKVAAAPLGFARRIIEGLEDRHE